MTRFLDSIIEAVPAMIFMKDARDLSFVRFNKAGEELLGLKREQLLGKTDYDFFPREQADFFVAKDREVLASGKLLDIPEEPIETPRGTRWLHTRKIGLVDDEGRPQYLLGISLDITDQRQQMQQAQKLEAVGRLAGGVAHDFNNLLTVILSHCNLLLGELPPGSVQRDDVREILEAGTRAAELTRQLLAFSRRQILRPTVLDLNEVVSRVKRLLGRLIGEDVEVTTKAADGLWPVKVDRTQIEQVLMNLAVNARDAMPTGGKLTFETANVVLDEAYARDHVGAQAGRHVLLAVSDTGVGIDKETLPRIFEPFFTTKEPGKGTGLGLSMVFGIIKQSNGSIWAYSEPGHGTTFKCYLPATDEALNNGAAVAPAEEPGGQETILLVEDEDAVRNVLAGALTRLGYRVLEAKRGTLALELAAAFPGPIDLLLTDVVMPVMGGIKLAEALRAARPELRIVFMSGFTDDAVVRHGVLDAGMDFLQKPITPDVLGKKIREVLRRRT